MDTQNEQVAIKEDVFWKLKRFFKIPRLYVSLLEDRDGEKCIFMRGFNKHEGSFAMDRFDVEAKQNVQTYFTENVGVWELLKSFISAVFKV